MSEPFGFTVFADGDESALECACCRVYQGVIRIEPDHGRWPSYCRTCLRRMRATLKLAEKALPVLPKRVRPKETP